MLLQTEDPISRISLPMSSQTTVLIVGAGASHELGFPIGEKLGTMISQMAGTRFDSLHNGEFPTNRRFYELASEVLAGRGKYPGDGAEVSAKLRKLSEGVHLTYSIDNYLGLHASDETLVRLGKIAIAHVIAEYESGSELKVFPSHVRHKPRVMPVATWYGRFFKALTSQCKFEDLPKRFEDVCIICFNYDRNIQRFFQLAIQGLYGVSEDEATTALKSLPVWHPYGSLGALPGLAMQGKATREYGPEPTAEALSVMADGLKTFTDGSGGSTGIARSHVSAYMHAADRFVFLGFGFLPANMQLLNDFMRDKTRKSADPPLVLGTCHSISDFDRASYAAGLLDMFKTERQLVHLADKTSTCADLFTQYSRALRFS